MSVSPYQPIDSAKGWIRLIVLHPATKHVASIVCDLQPVCLSSKPSYEALSYTWGSVGKADEILLNESKFKVWENAAAALRRLRRPRKKRKLWIDAICINQDDLAERTAQVLLMQQIYGQAQEVCIWLGELPEGGLVGVQHLQNKVLTLGWHQYWSDRKLGRPLLSFTENLTSSIGSMNRANLVSEQMNGEVRELLDRPWWRRTWVVQEAILAQTVMLMCGTETVKWEAVEDLQARLKWMQGRIEYFGTPVNEKDTFPDEIYRVISDYRQKWHSSPAAIHILDVLYRFRQLDCTDARDRIFGFLGIVPLAVDMGILPDYESTVTEVYWQTARKLILATQSLHVLNCKREWQGIDVAGRPAQAYSVFEQSRFYDVHALITDGPGKGTRRGWARLPDGWERVPNGNGKVSFRDHKGGEPHETSPLEGQTARPAEYVTKQRVLPPKWSKKWDNIGCAVIAYDVEDTPEEIELRAEKEELRMKLSQLPTWVPNWACPTAWDPTPLIDWTLPQRQYWASGDTVPYLHSGPGSHLLSLDGLIFDEILDIAPAWHPELDRPPVSRKGIDPLISWEALGTVEVEDCPYASTGASRANSLWRTMIADFAGDEAAPDDDWAFVETWYDRVGWAKDLPDMTSRGPYEAAKLESEILDLENNMLEHFLSLKPPPAMGFRETLKWSFTETFEIKKRYAPYMKRLHRVCAHRALYVTRRGYIGLAPWNSRHGDGIVVLNGGRTPFLVRLSAATGHLTLVGETYLYGIMAGEALTSDVAEQMGNQVLHIS